MLERRMSAATPKAMAALLALSLQRGEDADPAVVHAGTRCKFGACLFGWQLGPEWRKTGWIRAEAAGDCGP